jgi:hypothetical protein
MTDKPQHAPTIELDGARLRPPRVADAAALYAYLRDPVVAELTSYPVGLEIRSSGSSSGFIGVIIGVTSPQTTFG